MSLPSRRRVWLGVTALCAVTYASPQEALADNRSIIIDARYRPMREVRREYEEAVLGNGHSRVVNRRITILVSSRRGFDAGYLEVPRNVRIMRTHIDIIVYHGSRIRRTVSVNLLNLDRARIYQLNQSINIR